MIHWFCLAFLIYRNTPHGSVDGPADQLREIPGRSAPSLRKIKQATFKVR
jgi:hypothetical protein